MELFKVEVWEVEVWEIPISLLFAKLYYGRS